SKSARRCRHQTHKRCRAPLLQTPRSAVCRRCSGSRRKAALHPLFHQPEEREASRTKRSLQSTASGWIHAHSNRYAPYHRGRLSHLQLLRRTEPKGCLERETALSTCCHSHNPIPPRQAAKTRPILPPISELRSWSSLIQSM